MPQTTQLYWIRQGHVWEAAIHTKNYWSFANKLSGSSEAEIVIGDDKNSSVFANDSRKKEHFEWSEAALVKHPPKMFSGFLISLPWKRYLSVRWMFFFRCLLVYTSKVFVCHYVYMYEWVCAFRLSEYCRRKFTIFSLWFERLSCLVPMLIFHVQFSSCIRRQGSQREFHHQFLYLFAYISIRLFVITSILTGKNCGQLRKKWRPEEIGREKIPTFWIFNFDNIRG